MSMNKIISRYRQRVTRCMDSLDQKNIQVFADTLVQCIKTKRTLYLCGNGGSGSNANHIENDFIYGISKACGQGLKSHSLSSNSAVLTCLANDEGYSNVFSYPLSVLADQEDVLLAISGSGNSPNIINAIKAAKNIGMTTFCLLGFDGGQAKNMCDYPIHFEVNDMQVSEDMHMMVAHIVSQWLYENREDIF